jgi:ATP synthase protein I
MANPNDNNHDDFLEKIGDKEERILKARQEKKKGVWFGLSMMGTIGWSITIPALLGLALGLWLDSKQPGSISWTLTLLLIGIIVGCFNAYYWVKRQLRVDRKKQDDE